MAQQDINIGTVANDGTGDPLRTAFDKTNDNFTELYNVQGWGFYVDAETTPATQTVNTTFSKLQIDAGASETNEDYLPLEIRGVSSLWDSTNDKITPINIGDAYDIRVAFGVSSETGNPTEIEFQLDIGGAASPTTVIAANYVKTGRSTPYFVSIPIPVFALDTFVTNGGQLFLRTDTGSVTIAQRQILIVRTSSGSI